MPDAGRSDAGSLTDAGVDPRLCYASGWCWESPYPQGNHLNAVWGSSTSDVWAVGSAGMALHWDGTTWSYVETGTSDSLYAVRGIGSNAVWAVGFGGRILFWDGAHWAPQASGVGVELFGLSVVSPNVAWSVGDLGTVLRWNGAAWSPVSSGTPKLLPAVHASANGVWFLTEDGDVYRKLAGDAFQLEPGTGVTPLVGLWGAGEKLLAVGGSGNALRYDGASWASVNNSTFTMNAIDGVSWTQALAVGDRWASRWDGSGWSVSRIGSEGEGFGAVWMASPTEAFAVGVAGSMARLQGGAWKSTSRGVNYQTTLVGLWSNGHDAWAVDFHGGVLRRIDKTWVPVQTGVSVGLSAISGAASDAVWAVGADGTILHWNGSDWSPQASDTTEDLLDTCALARDDVWAVGGRQTVLRYDGAKWTKVRSSTAGGRLVALACISSKNVWAAGDAGSILHWDGVSWSPVSSGTTQSLTSIAARTPDDVWAVGGTATLRWSGTSWAPQAAPAANLYRLTKVGDKLLATNLTSSLLEWNGASWRVVPVGPAAIRSVAADGAAIYLVTSPTGILRKQL